MNRTLPKAAAHRKAEDLLAAEMAGVEKRLLDTLQSREPRLTEIALHLIGAGGKRIRPLVAMAIYRASGGRDVRDITDVAVALELIHSATLLHDDIIDGGETRRGRTSAYLEFGLADTLVAGDFLFSKAFELCGRFEERVVRWAAEACIALTEGEIMQGRFRRNPTVGLDDYFEIIRCKTASLFLQGARVAAHLAGAEPDLVESLARCGEAIGMAFQISDDLLDVEGDEQSTGKPVGIDLRDGNPSLPIVLALPLRPRLQQIWMLPSAEPPTVAEGLAEIREAGVLGQVRSEAEQWVDRAAQALAILPRSPYRGVLDTLVQDLRDRGS